MWARRVGNSKPKILATVFLEDDGQNFLRLK